MPYNKRKRNVKFRGSKTHGWGSMKKHRGAGNRGGRGMAGTGKRADQRKPTVLKEFGKKYFGRYGFKRPQKVIVKIKPFNIGKLNEMNFSERDADKFIADLKKLGYNKLLSKGNVNKAYKVIIDYATKSALDKIQEKGGEVMLKTKKETGKNKKE